MYVPGEGGVMKKFHVGDTAAALGLAIYVVGYGVGPLLWAPLSEIASIGRNWVYVPTFALFVILSIPTALVDNYAGLLVLRFITGFFGSPCLANGGASVGDMYSLLELPVYLSAWTAACFWGPAIGHLSDSLSRPKVGVGDSGKSSGSQAQSSLSSFSRIRRPLQTTFSADERSVYENLQVAVT